MMANSDSRVKALTRGGGKRRGWGPPKGSDSCVNRRGGGANSARVE